MQTRSMTAWPGPGGAVGVAVAGAGKKRPCAQHRRKSAGEQLPEALQIVIRIDRRRRDHKPQARHGCAIAAGFLAH